MRDRKSLCGSGNVVTHHDADEDRERIQEPRVLQTIPVRVLDIMHNHIQPSMALGGGYPAEETGIALPLGRNRLLSRAPTAAFIRSNARFMVTFAKLALKNIRIPHTSNAIERLMGEISKRCKHKWMHWSTKGLENILQIILVRYPNPQFYQQFWKAHIHPSQYQLRLTTPV